MATKKPKQTENKRRNGQFAPGNKLGNRFKPGETGNPAGRPKRTKLTEALTAKMAEIAPEAVEETIAERVAQALIDEALKGNVQAIREIGDRTEGKPRQTLDADLTIESYRVARVSREEAERDLLEWLPLFDNDREKAIAALGEVDPECAAALG
jgi:hypothetical protein